MLWGRTKNNQTITSNSVSNITRTSLSPFIETWSWVRIVFHAFLVERHWGEVQYSQKAPGPYVQRPRPKRMRNERKKKFFQVLIVIAVQSPTCWQARSLYTCQWIKGCPAELVSYQPSTLQSRGLSRLSCIPAFQLTQREFVWICHKDWQWQRDVRGVHSLQCSHLPEFSRAKDDQSCLPKSGVFCNHFFSFLKPRSRTVLESWTHTETLKHRAVCGRKRSQLVSSCFCMSFFPWFLLIVKTICKESICDS